MTSIVGALAEAWGEIRIHRARFILSLLGVFLAVFAMTTVQAFGNIGVEFMKAEAEREMGRPATVQVSNETGSSSSTAEQVQALRKFAAQLDASHSSVEVRAGGLGAMQVGEKTVQGDTKAVEAAYADIHRLQMGSGRWFLPSDAEQLSLQLVINPKAAQEADIPTPIVNPVKVAMRSEDGSLSSERVATVVGVTQDIRPYPVVYANVDQALALGAIDNQSYPSFKMWVPDTDVEALQATYNGTSALGPGSRVSIYRSDFAEDFAILGVVPWIVRVLGLFALGLASIGVINVGIVTVRNRVREIGVRRSFGATNRRVFAAILLESTVATFLAGALGVLGAIAVLRAPWPMLVSDYVQVDSIPPFPVSVAIESLLMATAIGAISGFIPAVIALKSKVIESIRF